MRDVSSSESDGLLRDPSYTPPLGTAVPLALQHVLAMFLGNITPAIIIGGAAGFGFGANSPDFPELIYLIQMSMLFAGVATLFQTIGFGPIGARLPVMQGTSFAFVPIMIPMVAGKGVDAMAAVTGGVIVGGVFHMCLAPVIGRFRFAFPPLVTGLVITMIGLILIKIGIQYAAGGFPAKGTPEYGSPQNWFVAGTVIAAALAFKFLTRGVFSLAAVLMGLATGYVVALLLGMVSFENVSKAAVFAVPEPFHFGVEFPLAAMAGFCLMAFVSTLETVGDVSGIARGGARREATKEEIAGATYADGLGSAVAGLFGALSNTSFSQNVGLVAITGVMSRHVVTLGALFLVAAGFVPKIGAVITSIPIEVLGGVVIVMFGMVTAAGISMLSDVKWTQRNMLIFAVSISLGLGLNQEPDSLNYLPDAAKIILASGLLPAALLAIVLNLVIPDAEHDAE